MGRRVEVLELYLESDDPLNKLYRRLRVLDTYTFRELQTALQASIGYDDELYFFNLPEGRGEFGTFLGDTLHLRMKGVVDDSTAPLYEYVSEQNEFFLANGFEDEAMELTIRIEGRSAVVPSTDYPQLLGGAELLDCEGDLIKGTPSPFDHKTLSSMKHKRAFMGYVVATVNLYGLISRDRVEKIFVSQHRDRGISFDSSLITEEELELHDIMLKEGSFIHEAVFDDELYTLSSFLQLKSQMPWYSPNRRELLRYYESTYIEKGSYHTKMEAFLRGLKLPRFVGVDTLIAIVEDFCRYDLPIDAIYEDLEDIGLRFERQEAKSFKELMILLKSHTRSWLYNGHTAAEVLALS